MVVQLVALLLCAASALTAASDTSTVIRQLGNAQRDILLIGMLPSRFLLIVGPLSQQAGQPIDIRDVYIFDLPPKAFSNGKLALSNGVKMSDKWPQLSALFGNTLLFTMQDDTNEYVWTMTLYDSDTKKIFDLNTGMVQSVSNSYTITEFVNTIVYLSNDKKGKFNFFTTCSRQLNELYYQGCADLLKCHKEPHATSFYYCYANGYLQASRDQKCPDLEDCLQLVAGFITDKRIYLFTNTTMMYSLVLDFDAPEEQVKVERLDRRAFFVKKPASALVGILIAVLLIGLLTTLAILYCCYRSKWACCRRVSKSLKSRSSHKHRHSSHKLKRHSTGKTRKTRKTHKKHSGPKLKV